MNPKNKLRENKKLINTCLSLRSKAVYVNSDPFFKVRYFEKEEG